MRGNGIGTHALVWLRVQCAQRQVAVVQKHARHGAFLAIDRHHLRAATDHQVLGTGHDAHGREVHRSDAGAAETVQGHATGANVVACFQGSHARQIAALPAALRAGAEDDIADIGGVEIVALGDRPEHGGTQMLRVLFSQGTFALFADTARCAAGVDNPCV